MNIVTKRGTKLLNAVSDYLWWCRQQCETRTEVEEFAIALRVLNEVRQGSPDPYTSAVVMTTGLTPNNFRKARLARAFALRREYLGSIPDYDPAEALRVKPPKTGTLHQMPVLHGDPVEHPVRRALGAAAGAD